MDKIVLLAAYQLGLITPQTLIPLMTSLLIATAIAPAILKTTLNMRVKESLAIITKTMR